MSRQLLQWPEQQRAPCGVAGALGSVYSGLHLDGTPVGLDDCRVTRPRTWSLVIWEPLLTKAPAPPKAAPWCCYRRTVIFYHSHYIVWPYPKIYRDRGRLRADSGPTFAEWDQIETRLGADDVVAYGGDHFVLGYGDRGVVWTQRRWWYVHGARIKRDERSIERTTVAAE